MGCFVCNESLRLLKLSSASMITHHRLAKSVTRNYDRVSNRLNPDETPKSGVSSGSKLFVYYLFTNIFSLFVLKSLRTCPLQNNIEIMFVLNSHIKGLA